MNNLTLQQWIQDIVQLCQPTQIHLCNGSQEEYQMLIQQMISAGTLIALNHKKRPNSYSCRSSADDVARVEEYTFICSKTQEEAGPTNNGEEPQVMKMHLQKLFKGCMRGRTLYIVPFSMGPVGSPMSRIGVQITDSPYVVCSMRIMTRIGNHVLDILKNDSFVPCPHSVGAPLEPGQKDVPWPCNSQNKYIVHFPEERAIWSFGSGYGGNALLGKKCFSLRIASVIGRDEGWLAEHMLILSLTNPAGKKKYFAAAFPSACGKTNLAMMTPTLPGWKVETVGDDIAWMKFGEDGRLYAINPEAGFFGVAPGTSFYSNPNAMKCIENNTLFTNVGLTPDNDVWWEGMTTTPPSKLINWLNHAWTPESSEKAAHPNARFTAPISQCPVIDPQWEDPQGVPISAILFGGRRSSTIPLVYEALSWQHGVFMGASISSETTAAAKGAEGQLRHDPFAMLPFCGYHMGDYFKHWLDLGKKQSASQLPKIYAVNWFRKNSKGQFLWPGYGDNSRILKWIFERCENVALAEKSVIGYIPTQHALDLKELDISRENLDSLFHIDLSNWLDETQELENYFSIFGDQLPSEIHLELHHLQKRILQAKREPPH